MVFENTGNEEQWYIDDKWLNKEVEIIETIEEPKKEVSLKEIDEEILTIDDFLDDFKF